ncbi:hypothetical protein CLV78_106262 [Aliiruegeria haliotis]|uniref:Antibiotic biosynthesis monooxygenase n=1 Tax=Aliiruegeria haliotis TaxID=1280846 RepID=A0A2T0RNM0_9RHOB|nr:hypothetical protein [Aliiruegeria haliotis]PRY22720.1 hypothetical protein CLV78_106262 [Aliiruegeria haliotis]
MFVRITPFKVKPEAVDGAIHHLLRTEGNLRRIDGLLHLSVVGNRSTGLGYVIAYLESEDHSERNVEAVAGLWGNFLDDLEEIPNPETYEAIYCLAQPDRGTFPAGPTPSAAIG